jgi:four helix bundle protein
MTNFRTLNLARTYFEKTKQIKMSGLYKNQFDRAVLSIILNLVEGTSRSSKKERHRFYQIAYGSFLESQALLSLLNQEPVEITNHLKACFINLLKSLS